MTDVIEVLIVVLEEKEDEFGETDVHCEHFVSFPSFCLDDEITTTFIIKISQSYYYY